MYRDAATDLDEHDRAVGSILIGESLLAQCERAADQIEDPRAPDRWRALRDAHDDYPEIWRQLDRARSVLAARGGNTMAYDEQRPTARPTIVALSETQDQQIDREALDEVRRAIAELKLAVPGADWGAIDRRTATLAARPELRRRHWVGTSAVIGLLLLATGSWFVGSMPERKVPDRELMRRELVDVANQRKVTLEYLQHAAVGPCNPPIAHQYVKLLVMDGRGHDAVRFADDYTGRCGEDTVVENWASAPRPASR